MACADQNCQKPLYARGYCRTDYVRFHRNGDLTLRKNQAGTALRWVIEAMQKETDDCLIFPFPLGSHGYGPVTVNGLPETAHRFVCFSVYGPPPNPNDEAAHSCGRRPCCNKRHLRWATRKQNHADKLLHGTDHRGSKHPQAKLTTAKVLRMREAAGPQKQIAKQFGVSQQTVSDIKRKRRWSWL